MKFFKILPISLCAMFNLVISTGRRKEGICVEELRYIADLLGYRVENTWYTGFDGLVTAKIDGDPVEFCRKVRELVMSQQYIPRFVLKIVPILRVVNTDLEEITTSAVQLAHELIAENETYRIDVRKRGVQFHRMDIIEPIARQIRRKVKLENPDKILHIEIFPSKTGIAVFREDDVFSLLRITTFTQTS